ncbi:MAG TPA: class I SAM-dependent methyltransferase [Syntrophales bacterium]|jgi:ribosomal protein L11 methylase PrmA|nr:class I SAM-dependent methyltransferase [Syntrophales bacterium]HPI56707.1 class I SAM-dependent methyltransferase [Syntrophales bacterium]HPN24868.1 class I SAM-dependent methyltransferase [Syntrophales bacterium]HQM30303.1 class I SAM-dependent methyltransferase [Syntrophales bacterium]
MEAAASRLKGSFRDPSGFIFSQDGTLFRSVSRLYQKNYDHLIQSGLYDKLVKSALLISHCEVQSSTDKKNDEYKIIQPEIVPFISYPYEWCFSQLKDAALTILRIQKQALEFNMTLKDASAYNIQYFKGNPILIDTLSFETCRENQPWIAYRQFCQHFLAPLALIAYRDVRLRQLMRIYIDGIPLDLASRLLSKTSWFNTGLMSHLHLHAKAQKRYETKTTSVKMTKIRKQHLLALINHLESAIINIQWEPAGTEWADYYEDTNYTQDSMSHKKRLVESYLNECKPETVWDLGANTGLFSRIASSKGIHTVAFDVDPAAVEKNYRQMRENKETTMLPLCLDLTNPSPALGWANEERLSLFNRGPADMALALALIHHLAISNNLPLDHIADFLSGLCRHLIIEFVEKEDSQVQRLLRSREDIFYNYTKKNFEVAFRNYFSIFKSEKILNTQRTLYLMKNLNAK